MLKLIIASTMQIMYLNVSTMLSPVLSIKPQEVGEMIELAYGKQPVSGIRHVLGYIHCFISKICKETQ